MRRVPAREETAQMIDETLFDAEEKMEKAVSVTRDDLSTIRTGRANPGMFYRIVIDYYGSPPRSPSWPASTSPKRGWSSSSPTRPASSHHRGRDPQLRPRGEPDQRRHADPGRRAAADRGAPSRTGQAGQGQGRGRQGLGAQHPPQGDGGTERISKDGEAGEDEVARAEKDLDKTTHQYVAQIDELVKHKEGELLEV